MGLSAFNARRAREKAEKAELAKSIPQSEESIVVEETKIEEITDVEGTDNKEQIEESKEEISVKKTEAEKLKGKK